VWFDGKSKGIEKLGAVYAPQEQINQLSDISFILGNRDSFLDLSNMVAYHHIFNKKTPVPYSSIYVTLNYEMQKKSLDAIKSNPPEIILITPAQTTDSGTVAFRAYPIYRHILKQGYSPYKYNSHIFLLPNDSLETSFYEKADKEFAQVMHLKHIGHLPIFWGSDHIINGRVKNTYQEINAVGTHHIGEMDEKELITGGDGFIVYQFDSTINGLENDFVKVSLSSEYELKYESEFQIFWADDNEDFTEEKSFVFKGDNGNLLIPMGTSPYWSFSENIKSIRFQFPATMEGKRFPEVILEIYRYSENL
jgi:hypothetical protein